MNVDLVAPLPAGPRTDGQAPFLAVLDPDAQLIGDGLRAAVELLERDAEVCAVLTSDRQSAPEGVSPPELRRSAWSLAEARSWSVASGLVVLRRSFVESLGGFRAEAGWDGAHDLLLRAPADARIAVVAEAGCVRPGPAGPGRARRSIAGVLAADLARRGVDGWVEGSPRAAGVYRGRMRFPKRPLVSVVVPTRDRPDLVEMVLHSIADTRWRPLEVVFVDNGTVNPVALSRFDRSPHRVVRADIPFNYSRLVNRGAAAARGDILVLLNNDIEVRDPDWLEALVEQVAQPDVGPVGALLRFPLGSIQHCGIAIGPDGPVHPLAGCDIAAVPAHLLAVPRDCTAVTAACLAIRADAYWALDGLESLLETNYSDVDLCLRAWQRGLRCVFTPHAELVHHEGASRGRAATPDIVADWLLFRGRWAEVLARPDVWWPRGTDLADGSPGYTPAPALSAA